MTYFEAIVERGARHAFFRIHPSADDNDFRDWYFQSSDTPVKSMARHSHAVWNVCLSSLTHLLPDENRDENFEILFAAGYYHAFDQAFSTIDMVKDEDSTS